MSSYIDHIVITAPSLEIGVKYVYNRLGVMPQKGGSHEKMGTHNYLLNLGDSIYLEIISINPNSRKPARLRWFSLDTLDESAEPKLLTWIVRTGNIVTTKQNSLIELGNIESMSRNDMNWLITILPDGTLPFQGIAPSLIQWQNTFHPTSKLPGLGCRLICIEGFHPQAESITKFLKSIDFKGQFSVNSIEHSVKPSLIAYIQTPKGVYKL